MKISFLKKLSETYPSVDVQRKKDLQKFCKKVGIRFRRVELLSLALTHRSYVRSNLSHQNNERLEFLGDSILGLVITEYLYLNFPESKEGDLAKIKSYIVSEEVLSKLGLNIGLDEYLLMGKGEEASGGRHKRAILEDAFEALIGAYYLDQGFEKIRKFVLSLFVSEIEKVLKGNYKKDYKTIFQEFIQKRDKVCPKYKLLKKTGPDHDTLFIYQVLVKGKVLGTGEGKSRKSAEQSAAKKAYLSIKS